MKLKKNKKRKKSDFDFFFYEIFFESFEIFWITFA